VVRVAVAPETAPEWVAEAVLAGGGTLVEPPDAEAVVWFDAANPQDLVPVLAAAPGARWVHLPWAGVEPYVDQLDRARTWTCGKGVYAEPVAEHAMLLAHAGLRGLPERIAATSWGERGGTSLYDRPVTILGGGGITEELLRHLAVLRCEVTVVRRRDEPVPGAARTLPVERLDEALPGAQVVFVALALTPATTGIFYARRLALIDPAAWLVNVARGAHVVTGDLVDALRSGTIAGAALDVTDPEPLPDGHPLWDLPNCIITPHTANTVEMARGAIERRISDNVRRFADGAPLVGLVDVDAGY
jgi:phosphoglycerate dehydrogenase-like enzyme